VSVNLGRESRAPSLARAPGGALVLERADPGTWDWDRLDGSPDGVIFQTREWVEFLAATQGAEPVLAAVVDDGRRVGSFTGLMIRRMGVRILGSPFPGWATESMGFDLDEGVSRRAAAAALVRFAFGPMKAMHLELKDRRLEAAEADGLGFETDPKLTYEVDLARDEDAIFGGMSSACRRAIRKADKSGVTVEEATGEAFADEYFAQLQDVFAKQALVPTYGVERVRALIRHIEPTGRLLMLRARSPEGQSIATAIFPAFNGTAYFWGGASWRSGQILRPNEALFWHAMRELRRRGVTTLDLGGAGDYKRKYGTTEAWVPALRRSRFPGLPQLRAMARIATDRRQRWRGRSWQRRSA
jgi:CelD/BcsL family acetyltransferase involved in cellulose biosynthesis